MTFKNIRDAIIADRFDASDDADVKNWVNDAYDQVLGMYDWVFKVATATVTVTSGSASVTGLPTDFGVARALETFDGQPVDYITPDAYERTYYGITTTGKPVQFTVENGAIKVGPISNETSAAYRLLYEKDGAALSADGDIPILPVSTHMVLVYGGAAIGLALKEDPNAATMEAKFDKRLEQMKRRYLADARPQQQQSPPYRPYS